MVDLNRSNELREAIEALFYGYRAFTRGPDRILAKRGLNRMHHRVLYFVGRSPGLSVSSLLETLDISKQALNAPLRQLINMNLISSDQAIHDGRVRELRLTAEGRRLESKLTGTQMKQLETVFSNAGKGSEEGWRSVMALLHES